MTIPTTHDDPATLLGALVSAAGAILGAAVTFDVLDGEQAEAILAVASTVLPLVVAALVRRYAWAPASVLSAVALAGQDRLTTTAVGDDTPPPVVDQGEADRIRPLVRDLEEHLR